MSLVTIYENNIKRKKEEVIRLGKEKARYMADRATKRSRINSANQSIKRTKSESTIKSKMREIERYENDIQKLDKKITDIEKRLANKEKEISDDEGRLLKEKLKEEKKKELERMHQQEETERELMNLNSRQANLQSEVNKLKESKNKITILFLASNPIGSESLDLDREEREIRESIVKSLNRDSIDFQTRWAVRVRDIFQAINETNPTIIHFCGHGTIDGELVFHDNNDNEKFVSNDAFAEMVAASSDEIRMIVFNNCFSDIQAQMIVDKVEATIGMNTSISDETAILFSSQLYSSIGFGLSLDKAFAQAKARLMLENTCEENTPELFVKEGFDASDIIFIK